MATFSFAMGDQTISADIPDEIMAVTIDAVAATYGYRDEIPDTSPEGRRQRIMIPNPQTKLQFMLAGHLIGHLNQITSAYIKQQAMAQAAANVNAPQIQV